MKALYRKIGTVTIIIYIFGVILTAFFLYKFPDELIRKNIIDFSEFTIIKPVVIEIDVVVGAVLLIGLIAIIMTLFANKTEGIENIVYVEKLTSKMKTEELVEEEIIETDYNVLIEKAKEIIHTNSNKKNAYDKLLSFVCMSVEASQGAIFLSFTEKNIRYLKLFSSFAYSVPESKSLTFEYGEGLAGQAAKEGKLVNIDSIPQGYITVLSGLGSATPNNLVIVPLKDSENEIKGVAEIASFKKVNKHDEQFLTEVFSLLVSRDFKDNKTNTANKD